jgi:hypothetical protein
VISDNPCREAFEKWHCLRWGMPKRIEGLDGYFGLAVNNLWLAWKDAWHQAARSEYLAARLESKQARIDHALDGLAEIPVMSRIEGETEDEFK